MRQLRQRRSSRGPRAGTRGCTGTPGLDHQLQGTKRQVSGPGGRLCPWGCPCLERGRRRRRPSLSLPMMLLQPCSGVLRCKATVSSSWESLFAPHMPFDEHGIHVCVQRRTRRNKRNRAPLLPDSCYLESECVRSCFFRPVLSGPGRLNAHTVVSMHAFDGHTFPGGC